VQYLEGLDVVSVLKVTAINYWVIRECAALIDEAGLMLGFVFFCMLIPLHDRVTTSTARIAPALTSHGLAQRSTHSQMEHNITRLPQLLVVHES
jgi:hypothetical protein